MAAFGTSACICGGRRTYDTDGRQRAEGLRLIGVGALCGDESPSNRMPVSVRVEVTKRRAHRR